LRDDRSDLRRFPLDDRVADDHHLLHVGAGLSDRDVQVRAFSDLQRDDLSALIVTLGFDLDPIIARIEAGQRVAAVFPRQRVRGEPVGDVGCYHLYAGFRRGLPQRDVAAQDRRAQLRLRRLPHRQAGAGECHDCDCDSHLPLRTRFHRLLLLHQDAFVSRRDLYRSF
jgi:hypothetical protein